MEKPTIEQVAWVFRNIVENGKEDGSFRHLIYDHMGFGPEAYKPLYLAGGMEITNELGRKERAVRRIMLIIILIFSVGFIFGVVLFSMH